MFDKIVICGMGVMGASLGHSLMHSQITRKVGAFVRRQQTIPVLLDKGLAHEASTEPKSILTGADLIVIATPVAEIPRQAEILRPHLTPSMIVTDVGSVKKQIVRECEKILGKSSFFVGSHPMTGTEKFGFENFKENLYRNAPCILTPTRRTSAASLSKVRLFWEALGCRIVLMSPEEHDENVTWVSHLPHVVSFALLKAILDQRSRTPGLLELAGGSFRDMTRVAGSSPELWTDILLSNQKEILKSLDGFQKNLTRFRALLKAKDKPALLHLLSEASRARNEFAIKQSR